MTARSILLAGLVGLSGFSAARAQEAGEPRRLQLEAAAPMPVGSANQLMAEAIGSALSKHPEIRRYRIDVVYVDGVAELQGQVANGSQRELVRQTVLSVPGVAQLRDRLQQVSAVQEPVPVVPPSGTFPPPPVRLPGSPAPGMMPPTTSIPPAPPLATMPQEPTPIFQAQPQPGMYPNPQYQQPPMPPYAWPTYAPYNNVSRVAYPNLHTHDQWPFIGPMYPYPKIPLGWRRVTLEWQDGNWWYGRESNSHDWWRVRYW